MLAVWSLVPLPFLNSAWTSGSSHIIETCLEEFWALLASMWDKWNCAVVKHALALPFFGIGMKTDLFQAYGHCWVFQICWQIECRTLTALSFRIWNSSTGIPSPPLALFIVMLAKAYLTLDSRMPASRWVITPSWLSGSEDLFCIVLLCILATSP